MAESARLKLWLAENLADRLAIAARLVAEALRRGNKVMFCGNGGSAADSQHLAAELVGRYRRNRPGLAALALTVDTSALTAIGNDFGFEEVFSRQVEALGQPGDVLVAISTSGRSPNVLRAVDAARALGLKTVGLVGRDGGQLAGLVDLALVVPSEDTARIQECHITLGHILCDLVEGELADGAA
ncbi:MAG: phosphoheptose isomerase [Chloroflexota bacterium]